MFALKMDNGSIQNGSIALLTHWRMTYCKYIQFEITEKNYMGLHVKFWISSIGKIAQGWEFHTHPGVVVGTLSINNLQRKNYIS